MQMDKIEEVPTTSNTSIISPKESQCSSTSKLAENDNASYAGSVSSKCDISNERECCEPETDNDSVSSKKSGSVILNLETSNHKLLQDNNKLKAELAQANRRWLLLQNRTKYLKDNYEMFYKLRAQYQEIIDNNAPAKMDTLDVAIQTWEGIVCATCLETATLLEHPVVKVIKDCRDTGGVVVSKAEINRLMESVDAIQKQALNYAKVFESRMDAEEIKRLRARKGLLEAKIRSMARELRAAKENLRILQMIVIKMERNRRSLVEKSGVVVSQNSPCSLTNEEQWIIRRIVARFVSKANKKTTVEKSAEDNTERLSQSSTSIVNETSDDYMPSSDWMENVCDNEALDSRSIKSESEIKKEESSSGDFIIVEQVSENSCIFSTENVPTEMPSKDIKEPETAASMEPEIKEAKLEQRVGDIEKSIIYTYPEKKSVKEIREMFQNTASQDSDILIRSTKSLDDRHSKIPPITVKRPATTSECLFNVKVDSLFKPKIIKSLTNTASASSNSSFSVSSMSNAQNNFYSKILWSKQADDELDMLKKSESLLSVPVTDSDSVTTDTKSGVDSEAKYVPGIRFDSLQAGDTDINLSSTSSE